jgi:hypothetical protein
VTLQESDLKDSLIDLEMKDVVDIVRVFSVLGMQNQDPNFVPELFPKPVKKQIRPVTLNLNKLELPQLSQVVLKHLQQPILHKLESSTLAQVGDLMLAYSSVSPSLLDSPELNFVG